MFIDLVDALRCPRPHDATWLVAAALEMRGRALLRGTLGCPICRAEFAIVEGIVEFGGAARASAEDGDAGDANEEAVRLAALLGLTEPGGIVAVGGAWEPALDPLRDLVGEVRALVLEPGPAWRAREPFGAVRGGGIPVATGALRGVALDAATADAARLDAAVRALQPRGRLVAPSHLALPNGVTELARDARHWVAERAPGVVSDPIPLRRAR